MAEPARREEARRVPPWIAHPERYERGADGKMRRREARGAEAPRAEERREEPRPDRAARHQGRGLAEELKSHGHQVLVGAGVLAAGGLAYLIASNLASGTATVAAPSAPATDTTGATAGSGSGATGAPTTESDAGSAALTQALRYQSRMLRAIDALLKREAGGNAPNPRSKPPAKKPPASKPPQKHKPPAKPPSRGGNKNPGGRSRPPVKKPPAGAPPRRTGINTGGPPVKTPTLKAKTRPRRAPVSHGAELRQKRASAAPRATPVVATLRAVTTLGRPRPVATAPIAVRPARPAPVPVRKAAAKAAAAPRPVAAKPAPAPRPAPAVVRAARPAARPVR